MASLLLSSLQFSGVSTWQQALIAYGVFALLFSIAMYFLLPVIAEELDPNDENF